MIIITTTIDNEKLAEELGRKIISHKLGACVQISKIKSIYNWKGKLEEQEEFKIEVKTNEKKQKQLGDFIIKNHKYDLPEIIVKKVKSSEDYLNWVNNEVNSR